MPALNTIAQFAFLLPLLLLLIATATFAKSKTGKTEFYRECKHFELHFEAVPGSRTAPVPRSLSSALQLNWVIDLLPLTRGCAAGILSFSLGLHDNSVGGQLNQWSDSNQFQSLNFKWIEVRTGDALEPVKANQKGVQTRFCKSKFYCLPYESTFAEVVTWQQNFAFV